MIIKYDKNNNPKLVPETKTVHNKAWRDKTAEEFRKKYGAWYYFTGVPVRKKKSWIDQFRKKGV